MEGNLGEAFLCKYFLLLPVKINLHKIILGDVQSSTTNFGNVTTPVLKKNKFLYCVIFWCVFVCVYIV